MQTYRYRSAFARLGAASCCALLLSLGPLNAVPVGAEPSASVREARTLATRSPSIALSRLLVDEDLDRVFEIRPKAADSFAPVIEAFDLTTLRPVSSADVNTPGLLLGSPSPQTFAQLDRRNHRVLVPAAVNAMGFRSGMTLSVVDARTLRTLGTQDLTPATGGGELVGAHLHGGKLYLLTVAVPGLGTNLQTSTTVIAQWDVESGNLDWRFPLPQCQRPLATPFNPAGFGRSLHRPLVYVACGLDSGDGATYLPGVQAIMRVSIDPAASQDQALQFALETFPIGGEYHSSLFDPKAERLFMFNEELNAAGGWVFDGQRDAWLGNLALPDNISQIGQDLSKGRLYLAGPAGLTIAEGRAVPLAQGLNFDELGGAGGGVLAVDEKYRRVFVKYQVEASGQRPAQQWYRVIEDTIPPYQLPPPENLDARTLNVEEKAGVTGSDFSAGGRAYGARVLFVGGTGALQRNLWGYDLGRYVNRYAEGSLPVSFFWPATGDRDFFFASAKKAFVARVNEGREASAAAIGLDRDGNTDTDFVSLSQRTGQRLNWQWESAACSDFGGGAGSNTRPGQGASSTAACDATKQRAEGLAWADGFDGLPVTIGRESAGVRARLDPELGAVGESTAEAQNIVIAPGDGAGRVEIGRITATARTQARGRPGTAASSFERTVSSVRITDAEGKPLYACDEANSCDIRAIADAANAALGSKMKILFPQTDKALRASSGGYQAVVQEPRESAIENKVTNNDEELAVAAMVVMLYHDGAGRSRAMFEIAAVQAESHYGIYLLPVLGRALPRTGSGLIPPRLGLGPVGAAPPSGATSSPEIPPPSEILRRIARGAKFLISSPREFGLSASLWTLLAGPAYLGLRRRSVFRGGKG